MFPLSLLRNISGLYLICPKQRSGTIVGFGSCCSVDQRIAAAVALPSGRALRTPKRKYQSVLHPVCKESRRDRNHQSRPVVREEETVSSQRAGSFSNRYLRDRQGGGTEEGSPKEGGANRWKDALSEWRGVGSLRSFHS